MQLLTPDILGPASTLSLPLLVSALLLGLALWAFGWRTHRFWVVLVLTVLAGIYGLYEAAAFQAQPVLASLLLAAAAGMLALALVRVVAFCAGGCAGVLILHELSPASSHALVVFLVAGLIGLFLFRFWIMALTSFSGTLLMAHAGLSLMQHSGGLDAAAWSETNAGLVNWVCGLTTIAGIALQFLLDRRRGARKDKKPGKSSSVGDREFLLALPLWGWGLKDKRKAG
jgi:hypothetical protein